jgi:flavodoxin
MNILVAYHSETGNTKKVAEAIYQSIPGPKEILAFDQIGEISQYDLIFAGFPIHEFGPSKKAAALFEKTIKSKKVALFITHAMLKEAPLSDVQINNCRNKIKENELLGIYSCRGALSEKVADNMLQSKDEKMRGFGKMRDQTIGHPDDHDIQCAVLFAEKILADFQ